MIFNFALETPSDAESGQFYQIFAMIFRIFVGLVWLNYVYENELQQKT